MGPGVSQDELIESWTLVDEDWRLVGNKTGANRLGFAALLKFFESEARFPHSSAEVPAEAVTYLAAQLDVHRGYFEAYRWSGRTHEYHRAQIRGTFGFREFTKADGSRLSAWLAREVCPVEWREEQLGEALRIRCRAERIEPPSRSIGLPVRPATRSLLNVLKESDFLADFTSEFTSVASREVLDRATLRRRVLLCLFALGTNMGIKAVVDTTGEHGDTEPELRHVRRHFITRDNLRRAITKLVSATFKARNPRWWGSGTACASDSKKFGSWESNLMTEWHNRYGGPGVMIYWHVERRSTSGVPGPIGSPRTRRAGTDQDARPRWSIRVDDTSHTATASCRCTSNFERPFRASTSSRSAWRRPSRRRETFVRPKASSTRLKARSSSGSASS